jgi:2,3-bisphosphoglycerate-dependent phosphoglycerate mutase
MKLYLVRHAQSANNVIWNGSDHADGRSPDPEITDTGHRQAELLAQHLAHPEGEPRQHPFSPGRETSYGLTHVYCSLMTRSVLTAEYISKTCGLDLYALPDIFEKNGVYDYDESGVMRGLPGPDRRYFEQRFPGLKLPEGVNSEGWWNRPAESHEEFLERMRSVVVGIKQRHADSDDCVVMVAHGDFIDQFINELMAVPRHHNNYQNDWVANWTFHNTSISRIDFTSGSHTAVYLNRIEHLPIELITW